MEKNNVFVKIATKDMTSTLIRLSAETLKPSNDAIYNEEFLCAQGLRSSIAKGFVIVAFSDNNLCGMLRFYPKKRIEQISIYQFVVTKNFQGHGVVCKMLQFLHAQFKGVITCKCPINSQFNNYFEMTGWDKKHSTELVYILWEWRGYE